MKLRYSRFFQVGGDFASPYRGGSVFLGIRGGLSESLNAYAEGVLRIFEFGTYGDSSTCYIYSENSHKDFSDAHILTILELATPDSLGTDNPSIEAFRAIPWWQQCILFHKFFGPENQDKETFTQEQFDLWTSQEVIASDLGDITWQ